MAFYRLKIGKFEGTATIKIEVDSIVLNEFVAGDAGFTDIEAGKTVTITVTLDPGFNSFTTISSVITGGPFTTSPFTFTMPNRDASISFVFSGEFAPVDGYQLKYFWEWQEMFNNEVRKLEIYEDGFSGTASEKKIQRLNYVWGNIGQEPTDTFIGSKIIFDIVAESDEFEEFLTGDNRKFKALYYHDTDVIFEGYINTDRLIVEEKPGPFVMTFEAIDGIKSFNSIRFIPQRSPVLAGLQNTLSILIGALNQTYVNGRNVNINCDIYEDGMDLDNVLFNEFDLPYTAIYNDGLVARFIDGERIVNDTLFISEVITRLVNPFFCNVYLWKNEWYIQRLTEYSKPSRRWFRYEPDGNLLAEETESDNFNFPCASGKYGFGNAKRESGLIYNEFTSILNLGVLDNAARGGIFESPFDDTDFFIASSGPFVGNPVLRPKWEMVNANPAINNVINQAAPDLSEIVRISIAGSESVQIFKTTKPTGISDADISYIEANTSNTGIDIPIVQENSNTLSLELQFAALRFSGSVAPTGLSCAVMLQIENNWLAYNNSTNTFSWSNTFTVMQFPVTNLDKFNQIIISDVLVPATGSVKIRLYQLINTVNSAGSQQNFFNVRYRNLKLSVEETEGVANRALAFKSETLSPYNRVYPDYETWIGDALTANSLSAIKLLNNEVSKSWTDESNTSLPLQAIQVQNLANLYGRKNLRVTGEFFGEIPDVTKPVIYNDKAYKITYFNHNSARNTTEVELFGIEKEITENLFVAVSSNGTNRIMTSPDGITWSAVAAPEQNLWYSVTYGNGLFVAVAITGTNRVMTSPDGITWTARTAAEQNFWISLTFGYGLFVAVGPSIVMTSSDGINWVSRTAAESNEWISVTHGNSLFVALSQNGTNRVMTSVDGITWTARTAAEQNNWTSVTYGNGLFVAVAQNGTNRVMTSSDGVTWTSRSAAEQNNWLSVTYGNGLFVAVAVTGTNRVMTSSDGITWATRTAAEQNNWNYVTYANGLFVAVSSTGTNRVMTSPDGINWTARSASEQNFWRSVTSGQIELT